MLFSLFTDKSMTYPSLQDMISTLIRLTSGDNSKIVAFNFNLHKFQQKHH